MKAAFDKEISLRSAAVVAGAAWLAAHVYGGTLPPPEVSAALGAIVGGLYDWAAYRLKAMGARRRRRR